MKFEYTKWPIKELADLYYNDKLDLAPPYQRNEVWTKKAQKQLIDTIIKHQPLPSFFIFQGNNGKFEMVDGQQRSRSILLFLKGGEKPFTSSEGISIDKCPGFIDFPLNITLITDIEEDEHIEEFYALVNKSGLRLNKPELYKAEYYDTNFLKLITDIINDDEFQKLGLFRSVSRMNDSDLVSELLALLEYGISEKKEKVDDLFSKDISKEKCELLKKCFFKIVAVLNKWTAIKPIAKTRYKQKNDLYTLFSLIKEYEGNDSILINIYKWLLTIEEDIYPSQAECAPFKNYAYHCVTQSNSRNARTERLKIIKEIIFPELNQDTTREILEFYNLEEDEFIVVDGVTMYDNEIFCDD